MAKYSKKIVDKICKLISSDSYTIAEICQQVGINQDTYFTWKKEKPEFSEAVEKAKDSFNADTLVECEKSLSKLIRGYDYEEKKVIYIENKEGKPKIKEQTIIKKHVAPSLGAIIHFQTNKDPENWKNRQTSELTGKGGKDLVPDNVGIDLKLISPEEQATLLEIARKTNANGQE